jgi:hypothetical protein
MSSMWTQLHVARQRAPARAGHFWLRTKNEHRCKPTNRKTIWPSGAQPLRERVIGFCSIFSWKSLTI